MKIFVVALIMALPCLASARSVTIDVSDDLTFGKIETYANGTTIITQPRVYGYHLKATSMYEAEANSAYVCEKAGAMKYVDQYIDLLNRDVRTVTFHTVDKSPSFSSAASVLETAICKL